MYYTGDWLNNMPHGEGKIFVNNKKITSGIFRYGKLIVKEGGKKEKKEKKDKKGNRNSKNSLMKLDEEKETGAKVSSKNGETDSDKKFEKKKEKISTKNFNNIAPLKNKNKVANPMDYKFGFLEKIKNKK
jgi:hypothetical protein